MHEASRLLRLLAGPHDQAEAQLGFWRAGSALILHLGGSHTMYPCSCTLTLCTLVLF